MKHTAQEPGGRKYVGEDFLAMQDLTLNLTEKFFGQFSTETYILHGCEITEDEHGVRSISAGVIIHKGKAHSVEAATNINNPYALAAVVENVDVPYKTGTGLGYIIYKTEEAAPIPGRPGIIFMDNLPRFENIFVPEKAGAAEHALTADQLSGVWESQAILSVSGVAPSAKILTQDLGLMVLIDILFTPTANIGQITIANDALGNNGSAICSDGTAFSAALPNILTFSAPNTGSLIHHKFMFVK